MDSLPARHPDIDGFGHTSTTFWLGQFPGEFEQSHGVDFSVVWISSTMILYSHTRILETFLSKHVWFLCGCSVLYINMFLIICSCSFLKKNTCTFSALKHGREIYGSPPPPKSGVIEPKTWSYPDGMPIVWYLNEWCKGSPLLYICFIVSCARSKQKIPSPQWNSTKNPFKVVARNLQTWMTFMWYLSCRNGWWRESVIVGSLWISSNIQYPISIPKDMGIV